MGLDMYVYAKRRATQFEDGKGDDLGFLKAVEKLPGVKGLLDKNDNYREVEVRVQAAYWRKANQIHGWIVRNCADGKDACQEVYFSREKMQELLELCRRTRAEKGKPSFKHNMPLPPAEGFFFGSTEIDEWYWSDIERSTAIFERLLALPKEWEFVYEASW